MVRNDKAISGAGGHGHIHSANKAANNVCRGKANGLTTVTPPQENPSCRSADSNIQHPAREAAARIAASQILKW